MDNFGIHQAVMDRRKPPVYSQSGLEHVKAVGMFGYSATSHSRIEQCSQSSVMEWEGKVDMSEDPNMDCSENYNGMEVSISRAKINSENLRLKKPVIKVAERTSETDLNMPDDIDRKLAAKKLVISPTEAKDESILPYDDLLGLQHKKRPQKRTITNVVNEKTAPQTMDIVKFKATDDLLQKIMTGTAQGENVCLTYNPQKFSDIASLERVADEQINSGTFGDVLKVKDTLTGEVLIQKKVKKNAKGEFEVEKNEIEVPLQFPDADNIAKFYGLAWDGIELTFVMENAGISLRQVVTFPKLMLYAPDKIEKIMFDVFTGISLLAKHGITHCDIKPENICVNVKTWIAKLVDFGSSKTRQNRMTYKGITPEYLDPLVNKFLYECHELKIKSSHLHQLEEKDDVFSAGLVGLFLLKKGHPMIQFFTGSADYPKDPVAAFKKRMEVIKQISELTDEMLLKLLDIPMSDVIGELLPHVLALDREKRWTAKDAAFFLQGKLSPDLQPPKKLRQEVQPYHALKEDLSVFVDLKEKNADKVMAHGNEKHEIVDGMSGTPDVQHIQGSDQGMGIALKAQPSFVRSGGILVPAKFKVPMQRGQTGPASTTLQFLDTASMHVGHQLNVRPKLQPTLPEVNLQDQENKDYDDLVNSFNIKFIPPMPQSFLAAHLAQRFVGLPQNQPDNCVSQPSSPQNAHSLLPNAETGQVHFHHGPVQEGQQMHSGRYAIQGLTGCVVKVTGEGGVGSGPNFETYGNLPDIDALMQPSDEQTRPKIKGVRRNRVSQD